MPTIVRAFLNSGVHVLVEKPIATDSSEADTLIALAERKNCVLTVGHQERFVFARTGLLDHGEVPLEVECWRMGPWTGRGADVTVVLDLMIHDLDLVHRWFRAASSMCARAAAPCMARSPMKSRRIVTFDNGSQARLVASRISDNRRRGMRAVYADGVIEIDFLTRQVHNTTGRSLNAAGAGRSLGRVRRALSCRRAGRAARAGPAGGSPPRARNRTSDRRSGRACQPRPANRLRAHRAERPFT